MSEAMLAPEEVARRLNVTEQSVYNWLRAGRLRGVKLGRIWRVRPGDLETFLTAHTNNTTWQERFDAVIGRIRSRLPTDLTEAEIDREIAVACEEARELVHARRR